MEKIPVAVIAGPTASGKTKLAVKLCKELNGEVVSADSMQIYKGMRIATAKPTAEEMNGVPHHLLNFQPLDKSFSAADYVELAGAAVKNICAEGRLPFLVGGTGLYIDSLLNGLTYEPNVDLAVRKELQQFAQEQGVLALHRRLEAVDPQAAAEIHPNNVKRVVRALEMYQVTGRTMAENHALSHAVDSPYTACYLCLGFHDRDKLYRRIDARVDSMMDAGLEDEVRTAFRQCGPTALQAIGCKEFLPYFSGECTLEETVDAVKRATRHYAKRQLTWFRRNRQAHWLWVDDYPDEKALYQDALRSIQSFLKGSRI
ncbi:MAG: tRNA (adenosine(37)-N6)-dimethylallyltransferase MiaA [Oscillospiraceae bacterium]|jgi:tRNA dimethylallyltransferase|nr:tRNA (adenosine(37)-N6)-dimethylallyltransferase MiaA [Oscillospiraceae bacterium]